MAELTIERSTTKRASRRAVWALVAACVLWGASFLFGKLALRELPASYVVLGRFTLASVLLLPLAWRKAVPIQRSDVPDFIMAALLMVPISFMLQFEGLARTTATRAALLVGAAPALMALAATWRRGEHLSRMGWSAVGLSTVGVIIMVGWPAGSGSLVGDGLVFASLLALTAWTLLNKRLLDRYPPMVITAYSMALGTIALAPFALWWDGPPPLDLAPLTWTSVAVLGVGCTALTYSLWNWGLQRTDVSRSGVFINIEPLAGALLGVVLLGDPLTLSMALGGSIILLATLMITRDR